MKTPMILRASLSLLALGAAMAANAIAVSIVSAGNYSFDPNDANLFFQDEDVLLSHIGALAAVDTLHVDGTYTPFTTLATYTGTAGTLVLDLVYSNTEVGGAGITTDSGTWSYVSGTGVYAGYAGGGSYSINYNALDDEFASTTVVGELQAVPEPASMVALSMGALALLRRRKKA